MNGAQIACSRCGGSGQIFNPAEGWPDECAGCGGSGSNWRYPGGAIARYYSGPLIGRENSAQQPGNEAVIPTADGENDE